MMKNIILKNSLPSLPKNYRWKFEPWYDGLDALCIEKRYLWWWEEVRRDGVLWERGDINYVAKDMLEKEFGPQTRNPFYGASE